MTFRNKDQTPRPAPGTGAKRRQHEDFSFRCEHWGCRSHIPRFHCGQELILTFMTGWAKYRALQSQNPVCMVAHMKLLCPAASSASSVVWGCLRRSRITRKCVSLIAPRPILALFETGSHCVPNLPISCQWAWHSSPYPKGHLAYDKGHRALLPCSI